MFYGTHNSATYANVVWWQYPFKWLSNLTSKCQSLNIIEQLQKNVRLFNFQVTYYKKNWYISHGLFIYNIKFLDILKILKAYSNEENKIYFQLYLDKNFIIGQNKKQFKVLNVLVQSKYIDDNLRMSMCWIEGESKVLYGEAVPFNHCERYWTLNWARQTKNILNRIPLPKRWSKKYNKIIKESVNCDCLMLDFIEY